MSFFSSINNIGARRVMPEIRSAYASIERMGRSMIYNEAALEKFSLEAKLLGMDEKVDLFFAKIILDGAKEEAKQAAEALGLKEAVKELEEGMLFFNSSVADEDWMNVYTLTRQNLSSRLDKITPEAGIDWIKIASLISAPAGGSSFFHQS